MNDEVRLIGIDDAGAKIDIPNYGILRGPVKRITIPLTSLSRMFNMYNGPKFIYFLDPTNTATRVRVTSENLNWSVDKIFGREATVVVKEETPAPVEEVIVPEVPAEETCTIEDVVAPEVVEEQQAPEVKEELPTMTSGYVAFEGDAPVEIPEATVTTTATVDTEAPEVAEVANARPKTTNNAYRPQYNNNKKKHH